MLWLVKDLHVEANAARRRAEQLDGLAAKIDADRVAGKQLDRNHATRAVHLRVGYAALSNLLGTRGRPHEDEWGALLDALWPQTRPQRVPCVAAASNIVPFRKWDPVAQATMIARAVADAVPASDSDVRELKDRVQHLREKADALADHLDELDDEAA